MGSQKKTFLLLLVTAGSLWAGWEGYRFLARHMASASAGRSLRRIAVMPLTSESGKKTRASSIVTERLTSEIASARGVEVVERSRLDAVLKEQSMHAQGVADSGTVRRIGAVLGADAVVTGSVIELDNRTVEVNARLVDAQDGSIVKAVTRKISKDWTDDRAPSWDSFDDSMNIDVELDAPEPLLPEGFMAVSPCERLNAEEARAVRMAVELEARNTAMQLKTGRLRPRELTRNPGSDIKDPELRRFFYARIKAWYYSDSGITPLTSSEEEIVLSLREGVAAYPCR